MKLIFATIALAIVVCGVASAKGYRYHAPKARTYHYAVPKLYGSPTHVNGYMKHSGTYVMPHMRTVRAIRDFSDGEVRKAALAELRR